MYFKRYFGNYFAPPPGPFLELQGGAPAPPSLYPRLARAHSSLELYGKKRENIQRFIYLIIVQYIYDECYNIFLTMTIYLSYKNKYRFLLTQSFVTSFRCPLFIRRRSLDRGSSPSNS